MCSFCGKAFAQSNDLTSHLRIHTGEKPFICDVCGQPFRQSSALKTHKKTHAERSPIIDTKPFLSMFNPPILGSLEIRNNIYQPNDFISG